MSSEKKKKKQFFERLNCLAQVVEYLPISVIYVPYPEVQESISPGKNHANEIVVQIEDHKPEMKLNKGTIVQTEEHKPKMKLIKETSVKIED